MTKMEGMMDHAMRETNAMKPGSGKSLPANLRRNVWHVMSATAASSVKEIAIWTVMLTSVVRLDAAKVRIRTINLCPMYIRAPSTK